MNNEVIEINLEILKELKHRGYNNEEIIEAMRELVEEGEELEFIDFFKNCV